MNTLASAKIATGNESSRTTLISGIITGQIAGLIMAVVVMFVFTVFYGTSPLFPVQVIGSMALGESALHGFNFAAVIAGLLLHQLGPSLLWGIFFGMAATIFDIKTTSRALVAGLITGVVSMIGPYVLIPTLMHALHGADYWNQNVPMAWDWAAHIVFGASFFIYPVIVNKVRRTTDH